MFPQLMFIDGRTHVCEDVSKADGVSFFGAPMFEEVSAGDGCPFVTPMFPQVMGAFPLRICRWVHFCYVTTQFVSHPNNRNVPKLLEPQTPLPQLLLSPNFPLDLSLKKTSAL